MSLFIPGNTCVEVSCLTLVKPYQFPDGQGLYDISFVILLLLIFLNLYLKIFVDSFFFILSIQLSCFFNQTDNLLIFNWFRPYVFNVIIDVVDLHLPSCYLFSICSICLLCFLFFPVFIFWFLVSHFIPPTSPLASVIVNKPNTVPSQSFALIIPSVY